MIQSNKQPERKTTLLKRSLFLLMSILAAIPAHASGGDDFLILALTAVFAIAVIGLTIALYVLVAIMARNRHRNVVLWLVLSFLASPILICVILWAIGDDENLNGNRIIS